MSVAGSYQKFDVTIEDPGIAIITFNTPECASPLLERGGRGPFTPPTTDRVPPGVRADG